MLGVNAGAIILTGIKHSGKSTLGKLLALRFKAAFYDTDEIIAYSTGKMPRELFLSGGEAAFMEAELDACRQFAQTLEADTFSDFPTSVIATGGGICSNEKALEVLRPLGKVIYIEINEDTAYARILAAGGLPAWIRRENPQTPGDARRIFHRVYEERSRRYRAFADRVFVPEEGCAEENADKLAALIIAY
jgi:shikimate kinase